MSVTNKVVIECLVDFKQFEIMISISIPNNVASECMPEFFF